MRTPQRSRKGTDNTKKKETNKLRKRAMKSKMMKKTIYTLGADNTKDDIADLINDSCVSNISIIGRNQEPPVPRATRKTRTTAKSLASSASKSTLTSLGNQINRTRESLRRKKSTMETENGEPGGTKVPVGKIEPMEDSVAEPTSVNGTEGPTRLQGVKNLLNSAIWGVPYAQVMEEGIAPPDANTSQNKEGRCIIS